MLDSHIRLHSAKKKIIDSVKKKVYFRPRVKASDLCPGRDLCDPVRGVQHKGGLPGIRASSRTDAMQSQHTPQRSERSPLKESAHLASPADPTIPPFPPLTCTYSSPRKEQSNISRPLQNLIGCLCLCLFVCFLINSCSNFSAIHNTT